MTNEDALKAFREIKDGAKDVLDQGLAKGCEGYYKSRIELAETAIKALESNQKPNENQTGSNEPLTLEQLRGMDGECVKVVVDGVEPLEMLALVEVPKNEDCVLLRNNLGGVSEFYSDDDLREDGIKAYSCLPAHIDREAWTAEWKEYTGADAGFHYCSKCGQQAFNYEDGGEVVEVLSDFCPSCGRPTTPKGLDELEKRLRGARE